MAALTNEQRTALFAQLMSDLSANGEAIGVTKPQLRAAVDAVDDWLEANAASLNSAIPQPARGNLTTAQKARMLAFVAMKRYGG